MSIKKITALYFSPTDNTRKAAECLCDFLAYILDIPAEHLDCTLPGARTAMLSFGSEDLLIAGFPVYAGRIPNKLQPYLHEMIHGDGTAAIPLVTYGNRSFGDALTEMKNELTGSGFRVIAGAALPCEHAFTHALASGRPDNNDLKALCSFADDAAEKINAGDFSEVTLPGSDPVGPYYTPLGEDGQPAKFLKARPVTDAEKCTSCGLCAEKCPMGSISTADPTIVTGICIKCQSCVRKCPHGAKYFDDIRFLSHVSMLEQNFTRHQDCGFFI